MKYKKTRINQWKKLERTIKNHNNLHMESNP